MDDFIAVLVLYKISLDKSQTFLSIRQSLKKNKRHLDLVVYDNAPDYNKNIVPGHYADSNLSIIYHPDYNNSGVSTAYNFGQNIGEIKNKKWIILLDQDTDFPEDTIEQYIQATAFYPHDKLFAPIMLTNSGKIISPCYFRLMRGFSPNSVNTGVNSLKKFSVINCGMCIDMNAFKENKGYNELIKLDFSDHDFIRRFEKSVSERFIVINLKVFHQLSTTIKNIITSDLNRFGLYLEGSNRISTGVSDSLLLKFNAFARALKLSVHHKSVSFIIKGVKNLFQL